MNEQYKCRSLECAKKSMEKYRKNSTLISITKYYLQPVCIHPKNYNKTPFISLFADLYLLFLHISLTKLVRPYIHIILISIVQNKHIRKLSSCFKFNFLKFLQGYSNIKLMHNRDFELLIILYCILAHFSIS